MAISDQNGTQQHRGAAPFLQDLILNHRQRSRGQSNFHRLQFRRMYRYGLSLLLVGVLCNWIGFAQNYFTPVRYLGVGCIIAGILCICLAFCRWLTMRSSDSTSNQSTRRNTEPNIHVIAVSVQGTDQFQVQQHAMLSKPPDYETAVAAGNKPPSYDEALRISPTTLLHLHPCPGAVALTDSASPLPVNSQLSSRSSYCTIDCPRCCDA